MENFGKAIEGGFESTKEKYSRLIEEKVEFWTNLVNDSSVDDNFKAALREKLADFKKMRFNDDSGFRNIRDLEFVMLKQKKSNILDVFNEDSDKNEDIEVLRSFLVDDINNFIKDIWGNAFENGPRRSHSF